MDEIILKYNEIIKNKIDNYIHIESYKSFPIDKDYEKGYIKRYFAKKKNDDSNTIIEISKEVYEKIQSENNSTKILFKLLSINWFIAGSQNNVYDKYGALKCEGVCEKNSKIAINKNSEFIGIREYLNNCLEFYR